MFKPGDKAIYEGAVNVVEATENHQVMFTDADGLWHSVPETRVQRAPPEPHYCPDAEAKVKQAEEKQPA